MVRPQGPIGTRFRWAPPRWLDRLLGGTAAVGGDARDNAALARQRSQAEIAGVADGVADGAGTVSFGPGAPPAPAPLDESGQPRGYQYRVGWNLPGQPGEGRPLSLHTLRELADSYDLLRKAIEVRKDELCAMRFDVIARDTDRKRARQVIRGQQEKIAEIRAFFAFPDGKHTWQTWLRMLLEDYFVIDAVTLWKWRTLGGRLHGLRQLDGATIKPLLTVQGDTPEPPDVAYQQYLYGVARDDFRADELIYAPKNRRVQSPYGFGPVEQFLTHINMAMRYQRFQADYFTDGTLPEGVATAPESWTPAQIAEFKQYWDELIAGDSRAMRKLQFVPAGFKFETLKPWTFDVTFARWLAGVTCAALDVTPQELGFEPLSQGLGGRGYAEEQAAVLKRKSIGPLVRWLCDEIINPILWEEFGARDLQATFQVEGEEQEELYAMQARDLAIRNGTLSIDQAVEEDGGEAPGIGRLFVVGSQVLGEPDLVRISHEGVGSGGAGLPAGGVG